MGLETTESLLQRILDAQNAVWPTDSALAVLLGDCHHKIQQLEELRADEKKAADQFFSEARQWQRKYHETKAELTRRIHQ